MEAEAGTVNVLIVLDRSGSMLREEQWDPPNLERWNGAVTAITTATGALDDRINFGLMLLPGTRNTCSAGRVEVPVGPMNAATIADRLSGNPDSIVGGATPTTASLRAAQTALESLEGENYVLLVTDGGPNCGSGYPGPDCRCTGGDCRFQPMNCSDHVNAIAAVETLRDAGIGTYVVGYDTPDWIDVLDGMAMAGGSERSYPVGDGASLESALRAIGGSVVSCSYDLAMPPGNVRYVRVTVDGVTIPHESVSGDGNGWVLEGDQTVTLIGSACEGLKDGESHDIGIAVECSPVIF